MFKTKKEKRDFVVRYTSVIAPAAKRKKEKREQLKKKYHDMVTK